VGLFFGGVLILLQRPVFTYFTLAGGVFLLAAGFFKFVRGPVSPACGLTCVCEMQDHEPRAPSRWRLAAQIAILLVPVIMGLLVQGKGLNALAAMQRGIDFDVQALVSRLSAERELNLEMDESYHVADVSQVYSLIQRGEVGKEVATDAFVAQTEGLPEGHIIIVRFLIWCCSADARPLPVMVVTADADKYKRDQWVRVYGKLEEREFKGDKVPTIVADRVRVLEGDEIPERPYLY
jgi:uncharacterized repeat protein (TIGR03943 family)